MLTKSVTTPFVPTVTFFATNVTATRLNTSKHVTPGPTFVVKLANGLISATKSTKVKLKPPSFAL